MNDDRHLVLESSEYRKLIEGIGRVRLLPPSDGIRPLPIPTRATIAAIVQQLRRETIPRFEYELGVPCPFIAIFPVCWFRRLADGSEGITHGQVGPHDTGSSLWIYAIRIPASSLLTLDAELVEGVLAHEFLHYAWETIELHRRNIIDGQTNVDFTMPDYHTDHSNYLRLDRKQRVEPADWLPPRLAALAARVENHNDEGMKAARARLEYAAAAGVPPCQSPTDYSLDGRFALDGHVLARAAGIT
jgi:hypothetical protein